MSMNDFVPADKPLIDAIEEIISNEFTVSNAIGDTLSGFEPHLNLSLNDGTNLTYATFKEAADKLVARQQQFC